MPPDTPPHWLVYFGTADVEASLAKVSELGGTQLTGADGSIGAGKIAVAQDPQGAVFALYAASSSRRRSRRVRPSEASDAVILTRGADTWFRGARVVAVMCAGCGARQTSTVADNQNGALAAELSRAPCPSPGDRARGRRRGGPSGGGSSAPAAVSVDRDRAAGAAGLRCRGPPGARRQRSDRQLEPGQLTPSGLALAARRRTRDRSAGDRGRQRDRASPLPLRRRPRDLRRHRATTARARSASSSPPRGC